MKRKQITLTPESAAILAQYMPTAINKYGADFPVLYAEVKFTEGTVLKDELFDSKSEAYIDECFTCVRDGRECISLSWMSPSISYDILMYLDTKEFKCHRQYIRGFECSEQAHWNAVAAHAERFSY